MKRFFKTVKTRIVLMLLAFVLAISALVFSFSYYIMYTFQRSTMAQSTQFNLQLVAGILEQDLIEVFALANWCSNASNAPAQYIANGYSPITAVDTYNRLLEEFLNNRANRYISRLLVSDPAATTLVQTGTNTGVSRPLSADTIATLDVWEAAGGAALVDIAPDPFSRTTTPYLTLVAPTYSRTGSRVQTTGTVYMAVYTAMITDKLRDYNLPEGAALYFTLNGQSYQIEGSTLTPATSPYEIVEESTLIGGARTAYDALVRDDKGAEYYLISCTVREGITLSQLVPTQATYPLGGPWGALLAAILGLIALLALLIITTMNRTISRPVARIRQKVDAIAKGDFTPDEGIESDSEIGEVGRGVNNLTREVVALMDARLQDEQNKRELEYRMLQAQINPHFMYNTLNSIKWMATLQGADGIAEMTTALSRLLKNVSKDIRKVVPLHEELALLEDYYTIQKYRYGGAVSYEKQVEEERLLSCEIPRFVLQPLVENAIFHGIEPKGEGKIRLLVAAEDEDVLVTIEDNGVGMSAELIEKVLADAPPGENQSYRHLGLHSVHQRIYNAFGEGYGLTIHSTPGEYTRMALRLPFQK